MGRSHAIGPGKGSSVQGKVPIRFVFVILDKKVGRNEPAISKTLVPASAVRKEWQTTMVYPEM
jgi:hypothetical protein